MSDFYKGALKDGQKMVYDKNNIPYIVTDNTTNINGGTAYNNPQSKANTNGVTDNSQQISSLYDNQLADAKAALKASIQSSMQPFKQTIKDAPKQYYGLKNEASARGQQNLQALREMLANGGQQGGVNRTEETQVNSATENNINNLNMQQQKVIDEANTAIANLKAQGDIQGAQLVAQNARDKIRALIEESNRVDSTNYARSQDMFNRGVTEAGLTGNYNGLRTLAGQNYDNQLKQQAEDNAFRTDQFNWQKSNSDREHDLQLQQLAKSNSSSNGLSKNMSVTSSFNKEIADINDLVNGTYNLSDKQRSLQRYINDLDNMQGNEAEYLKQYALNALDVINKQMSDYVNVGRYAGM